MYSDLWGEELLVGLEVTHIAVKDDTVWIGKPGGRWVTAKVEPDCCSEATLVAVQLHSAALLDSQGEGQSDRRILSGKIGEIEVGVAPTTQEYDTLGVVSLMSKRNVPLVTIVHRNSSNGYYNNYISWSGVRTWDDGGGLAPPEDAITRLGWWPGIERLVK